MPEVIRFKPHHLVDIFVQYGEGIPFTPDQCGNVVHIIAPRVLNDPEIVVEMESGIDDICKACTSNVNGSCVDTIDISWRPKAPPLRQDWNLLVDRRYLARLDLKDGDQLTAGQFAERVRELTIEDFNRDLYPELPNEWNTTKLKNLKLGVGKFLDRR